MKSKLFISDLHLDDSRPEITQGFYNWLSEWSGKTESLYILGDFFEVWIGDDADWPLANETAKQLSAFNQAGADIFLMHGNRDFLMGDAFAAQCGATLIQEPTIITICGQPVLLMHGDALCIDDVAYMAFRQQVRNPVWQQNFLAKPLSERVAFSQQARQQSQRDTQQKSYDIMDVNPDEVIRTMESGHVKLMIHGHTHRPNRHSITVSSEPAERIVLGDWGPKGWYLVADENELNLQSFDL